MSKRAISELWIAVIIAILVIAGFTALYFVLGPAPKTQGPGVAKTTVNSTTIPLFPEGSTTASPVEYNVTFSQIGACNVSTFWAIPWSVTIDGVTKVQPPEDAPPASNSTTGYEVYGNSYQPYAVITFFLKSGVYNYSIGNGVFFTPSSGVVNVQGNTTVDIDYTGTSCTTQTHESTSNNATSTTCSISGQPGGMMLAVLSDSTYDPVSGVNVSATNKPATCNNSPATTQETTNFTTSENLWNSLPTENDVGYLFTLIYENHTYNFTAELEPVSLTCAIIYLPSGKTNVTLHEFGMQCPSLEPTFQIPNSTVSSLNSTLGLDLQLFVAPSNGTFGLDISAEVLNARDVSNNVTDEDLWWYSSSALNPFTDCGSPGSVGFGIFRGYFNLTNTSIPATLPLYNNSGTTTWVCSTSGYGYPHSFSFLPQSDEAELIDTSGQSVGSEIISIYDTVDGYWYNGGPTFQQFPAGNYTIIAADEWGQVAFLHFTVVPPSSS